MTTTDIAVPSDRLPQRGAGQATLIEQSRAVAEVHAAVYVAQQFPRDVQAAVTAMRESCAQIVLAQRAFFRYSRGGSAIQGPSIHLARELARVWGNIQYGISELSRDDTEGVSEMQAFAWDLQTNTRPSAIFIVPHKRDTKTGQKDLTDLRDVYENNANQGARRVREQIFAVLPPWFTEEAKSLCMRTIEEGGGKPLAQRIADAVRWFEQAGVRLAQLEMKLGTPRADWGGVDIAQLEVISRSLRNGETRTDDEFPPARVPAAEIQHQQATPTTEPATPDPAPETQPEPRPNRKPMSAGLRGKLFALFAEAGITRKDGQLDYIENAIGRRVESRAEVNADEADVIVQMLEHDIAAPVDPSS